MHVACWSLCGLLLGMRCALFALRCLVRVVCCLLFGCRVVCAVCLCLRMCCVLCGVCFFAVCYVRAVVCCVVVCSLFLGAGCALCDVRRLLCYKLLVVGCVLGVVC